VHPPSEATPSLHHGKVSLHLPSCSIHSRPALYHAAPSSPHRPQLLYLNSTEAHLSNTNLPSFIPLQYYSQEGFVFPNQFLPLRVNSTTNMASKDTDEEPKQVPVR